MLEWQKELCVDRQKATPEDAKGKMLTGEWYEKR
jgi:hypothetical protein